MLQEQTPDTVLAFDDQRGIPVLSYVLRMSSQPLAGMLDAAGTPKILHVAADDPKGWLCTLEQLYPTYHQPLTWVSVLAMIPIVHKYNFTKLLDCCQAWLGADAQQFSTKTDSPAFALRWLDLAETLHLDTVRTKVLVFVATHIATGRPEMLRRGDGLGGLPSATLALLAAQLAVTLNASTVQHQWLDPGDYYYCVTSEDDRAAAGYYGEPMVAHCLRCFAVESNGHEAEEYAECPKCKGPARLLQRYRR